MRTSIRVVMSGVVSWGMAETASAQQGGYSFQQPPAGSYILQQPMAGSYFLQQPPAGDSYLEQPELGTEEPR